MSTDLTVVPREAEPDWARIHEGLSRRFPADEIGQRQIGGGELADYLEARSVMDRLDQVVGPQHWSDSYRVIDPQRMAVECTLTVHGVAKSDVGYPNGPKDAEPYKTAYSDAIKRAAIHWGIGRFLYPKASGARRTPENASTVDGRQVNTETGEIVAATRPTESKAHGHDVIAARTQAIGDMGGAMKDAGKSLREGCDALGLRAKKGADLSLPDIARLTDWARTQAALTRTNTPPSGQEPAAGQEYVI